MRNVAFQVVHSGMLLLFCVAGVFSLTSPAPVSAGHKLDAPGTSCNTCHSVGGASEVVVANTRLIKKDARILEILNGGWSTGQPLPCIYCHDGTSQAVRSNMAGVKNHFSNFSLSKHPVDGYTSNNTNGAGLDCVDCHTNVSYVGGGNSLSPNIHNQDVSAITWTGAGLIDAPDTFVNYSTAASVSILNSEGNSFCTRQCHDASHTGYAAQGVFHGYSSTTVTLDDVDAGGSPAAPTGCIDTAGSTDGCHDIHHSDNNIGLVTLQKSGGGQVARSDCGICHEFDDQGAASDWSQSGHGMFATTNNIQCTSCHDASGPHFESTGSTPASNPSLLSFAVSYGQVSGLTGLPVYANCVSSNCHADYTAHSTENVGCIDCHEVHGKGVSPNIKMMRRTIPGGGQTMQYTGTGQHWDSTTAPGIYSNWLCDNQDCHGGSTGPGPISSIMSTSPANTTPHSGGIGIMGNCDTCHKHQGGANSWATESTCDTCHGYPPNSTNNHHAAGVSAADHDSLAILINHDECWFCHGVRNDGSNQPSVMATSVLGGAYAYSWTADHRDGKTTMNGNANADSSDDAGYNTANGGCDTAGACHENDATHRVGNGSAVSVTFRDLGPGACNSCHGYPPTSSGPNNKHAVNATPVDHAAHSSGGATLLGQHDDCVTCHGTKDDGNSQHAPNANYQVSTMHNNGSITMNGPVGTGTGYSADNWTCTNTCHTGAESPGHQLSDSGLPVDYGDFGAGSCDGCHGPGGSGPTVVWPSGNATGKQTAYGSHLTATTSETLSGTTDWNNQCNKCHDFHSGPISVPLPPTSWNNISGGGGSTFNMQTRLGLAYTANGALHLGTAGQTGSEADYCWGCHSTEDEINEWGFNWDTNGSNPATDLPLDGNAPPGAWAGSGVSHNYGWLYNSGYTALQTDWTLSDGGGAYRKDAYMHDTARLSRRIFSIHSANVSNSGSTAQVASANQVSASGSVIPPATLERKNQIRCSYCHDVHDLNAAQDPFAAGTESNSGRPFLRGSWMGNPYPPDFPPRSGNSYPVSGGPHARSAVGNRYTGGGGTMNSPTPRLFADPYTSKADSIKGGYWVDANSGNPTSGESYSTTGGVCALCHGTTVNGMDYYTSYSLWRSGNGHNNSVLGGTGTGRIELFDAARYMSGTDVNMGAQDGIQTTDWGSSSNTSWPFWGRGFSDGGNYCQPASNCPPANTGFYGGTAGALNRNGDYTTWYGGTTPVVNAHVFTCSKCHSPHATGLPVLLITNCLDTSHSDWSTAGGEANPTANSANNCHRKTSTSTGWTNLAPGQ